MKKLILMSFLFISVVGSNAYAERKLGVDYCNSTTPCLNSGSCTYANGGDAEGTCPSGIQRRKIKHIKTIFQNKNNKSLSN